MLNITALRAQYRTGTLTPLAMIEELITKLDAYPDKAVWISRKSATQLRAEAAALGSITPSDQSLWGIPFAVKDNIDCAGFPTTAGSPAYAYDPAVNAHAVQNLLDAGAILIGKTNLDQFATGLNGTRSPHGAPRSVFDKDYISGGSSSGSAVAVAACLVSFALGTDTAGSGRVPAAFNNLVGLKPTKGVVSTSGLVPACRSIDCITVLAPHISEADEIFRIMRGFDAKDAYSRPTQDLPIVGPLRVGVLAEKDQEFFGDDGARALYRAAIENFRKRGAAIIPVDYAPLREAAALLYEGAFVAERAAAIGDYAAKHPESMDPTVAKIIAAASDFSAVQAFNDIYELQACTHVMAAIWQQVSFLMLPTAPTSYTVKEMLADPITLNARLGLYTNFVNLLDCAAIAIPAGFGSRGKLPFGVTLVGPAFTDRALAHHAAAFLANPEAPELAPLSDDRIAIAVAGAHMSGQPLNSQLQHLGAQYLGTTRTAANYRLFALANTTPAKPGLVFDPGFKGEGIEIELWSLTIAAFGQFVAMVPRPMVIGKIELADASQLSGFLCEPAALESSAEITHLGGWRAFVQQQT